MISYVASCELSEFPAWGGGKEVLDELIEHPKAYSYIENIINNNYECTEIDKTFINDFLWYDVLNILDLAYLYDAYAGTWSEDM